MTMFMGKIRKFRSLAVPYFVLLLSLALSSCLDADSINLAEGRSYSLSVAASPHYPDTSNLLTDGQEGADINTECGERLCIPGWVGFEYGTPIVTIDLESAYEIDEISVSFLTFPAKGVNAPREVQLLSSFDGLNWTPRGKLVRSTAEFELTDGSWNARYFRFIIARDQWTFLDEIRIDGDPEPVPPGNQWEKQKGILVVSSNASENDERILRLANILDGLGTEYAVVETSQLAELELLDYQLVIMTSSNGEILNTTPDQERQILNALEGNTNVLLIGSGIWGSFQNTLLADAFGLRYVAQNSNENFGVGFAQYLNLDGETERLPLMHETIWVVEATDAAVEGWFLDEDGRLTNLPFITRKEGSAGRGSATFISLAALDRWKSDEDYHTFARAEIVTKAIRSLTRDGLVGRHPVPGAHDATLLLRLEDYTPGGFAMGHGRRPWLIRMNRLLELTDEFDLPLNIGIVPVYNHPYRRERHDWGSQDPSVATLKAMAQEAFSRGGSLIVHGHDHQNGDSIDDYSGADWETYDEDTEQFLSLVQQQEITDLGYAEIERHWGIRPAIWETPHYVSNEDTFSAARSSGFQYFTESDTKLFPNWNGLENQARGLLLNIPETGAFFQNDARELKEKTLIKQLYILPRFARLNAPLLVFFHNNSERMLHALHNFLMTSVSYDLWKPGMENFGGFWKLRKEVGIDARINRIEKHLRVSVENAFDGFTLAIQLPQNTSPIDVLVNGRVAEVKKRRFSGTWLLYPVLEGGSHDVAVSYD